MKKGLLSILAGALLVVGCQNYDDQFDALESQINALGFYSCWFVSGSK